MNFRDRFVTYYDCFGINGLLAIGANRLFQRPKEISAKPPGVPHPLHLRMRTSDVYAYAQVLLQGEYAFEFPFSPKTIIDAGANVGMASIYFACNFPEARIVAVEPEASNFAQLARNVQPYRTVTPVHAALWNRDDEISVCAPGPATGTSGKWGFVTQEGPGAKVRSITLPTLMKEMQMPSVDVLKMDIEGAEKEVLESCLDVDQIRCLMVELHDRFKPGCSIAADAAMQGFTKLQRAETTIYFRG
jgi:FkbM family methyltransferase